MKNKPAAILATWFGCGLSPRAPGTVGSLAAILIAFFLHRYWGLPPVWYGLLAAAFILPAIWAADVVARELQRDDPGLIVIDEVVGQWLAIAGAPLLTWKAWLAAFLLFRAFDIWKPLGIRRLESLPGGVGIVADDVLAGVYAALVLFALGWFNLY